MGDMYCSMCHRFGIYWTGLGTGCPHTYCPHCQRINCQQIEEPEEECTHEISDNAGHCAACGEIINQGDK